jgi:hypothetical protein
MGPVLLLTSRKLVQCKLLDLEADLRGTSRNFGLKVGIVSKANFEARITETKLNKLLVAIRGALRGQQPNMRKAYLQLFVDNVIISKEEIRISGPGAESWFCGGLSGRARLHHPTI